MIRRKENMTHEYINPRLSSGVAWVLGTVANTQHSGQSDMGFIWYEQEFSLCKNAKFRKLFESRALAIAEQIRRENDYNLEIRTEWTVYNELVVWASVKK